MEVLKKLLFSTTTMGVLLLIFLSSIGIGTFIENSDSTEAARILVYNARWFEGVLVWLAINLIVNTFRYRMWRLAKISVLTFHLAFIVILLGAGVSRYFGAEGVITVGKNETVDFMYSSEPYLNVTSINKDETQTSVEMQKWFAKSTQSDNQFSFDFPRESGPPLRFEYVAFIPNSIDTVEKADNGSEVLEFVIAGKSVFIPSGMRVSVGPDQVISFNNNELSSAIQITSKRGKLSVVAPYDATFRKMSELSVEDRQNPGAIRMDTMLRDTEHPIDQGTLYNFGPTSFVLKNFHNAVNMTLKSSSVKDDGIDALVVNAISNNVPTQIVLKGGKLRPGIPVAFEVDGQKFIAKYGSKQVKIPFDVSLKEFRLLKYAGSQNPSSYESDVIVSNPQTGDSITQTILMNHVMDYQGYRLFQSSYNSSVPGMDPDITILSVNQDFWGTWITYIGYLLMGLGFVFTLFFNTSRFRELIRKVKRTGKKITALSILLLAGLASQAQDPEYKPISPELSEIAGRISVQNKDREKPLHTYATEVLRKLHKADMYEDQDPVQVFLGMTFRADHWFEKPILKLRSSEIGKKIGISGSYASYEDFYGSEGVLNQAIAADYNEAFKLKESKRNTYQKELLKTIDKLELMKRIFWRMEFKVFPVPGDGTDYWTYGYEPEYSEFKVLPGANGMDSLNVFLTMHLMDSLVAKYGTKNGDFSGAVNLFKHVGEFQKATSPHLVPSEGMTNFEISYNKQHVLDKLYKYYMLMGLLILIFEVSFTVSTKSNSKLQKWTRIVFTIITLLLAVWHVYALAGRWIISGHAPWSNGYEALVFIGFMTVLAGIIFSKQFRLVLGAGAILGGVLLMTAHHSNYDPDITPLVPVLKSYWLMIHVAVITGSYGFLGLGSILGFISLLLHTLKTKSNFKKVQLSTDAITYISEMTITIGLIMAAVGTFLGGVWANESWGRYWGWDAKETWALVIVLFYAILLHLRFIPGMKSKFLFNAVSMWGYSTVLMTFFGVNYYLSGLHSYAQGDAPPFPMWATITIICIGLFTVISTIRYIQTKQYGQDESS